MRYWITIGASLVGVAALVTVVEQHGTPEMAAGALQRYLVEAPWLPTALLPSAGVVWTAIDERTARATIRDTGIRVSVDFHFGPQGEIVGMTTDRYRDVHGMSVLTPWVGRFSRSARVDGMMVPREGEVGWTLPDGPSPYWRARIVESRYEPAP